MSVIIITVMGKKKRSGVSKDNPLKMVTEFAEGWRKATGAGMMSEGKGPYGGKQRGKKLSDMPI